jgi:hypothetical protein
VSLAAGSQEVKESPAAAPNPVSMARYLTILLSLLSACAGSTFDAHAAPGDARAEKPSVQLTPPLPWARDLGAPPRIPLVGDVDGDGYADLLSLWSKGDCWLEVALNDKGVKSLPPRRVLTGFGRDCIAATTTTLTGEFAVVGLFRDGTVRVATGFGETPRSQLWGRVQRRRLPDRAWLSVIDGRENCPHTLLVVYADGTLEESAWALPARPGVTLTVTADLGVKPQELALRQRGACGITDYFGVTLIDAQGHARTTTIPRLRIGTLSSLASARLRQQAASQWERVKRVFQRPEDCGPDDGYALAREMLSPLEPTGNRGMGMPERHFVDLQNLRWDKPSALRFGDVNGDQRLDLLRFRQDGEPQSGADVLVYLTYREGESSRSDGVME